MCRIVIVCVVGGNVVCEKFDDVHLGFVVKRGWVCMLEFSCDEMWHYDW